MSAWSSDWTKRQLTSGKVPLEKTMRRQVSPQAPSPTITSFLRISDIVGLMMEGDDEVRADGEALHHDVTRELQILAEIQLPLIKSLLTPEQPRLFKTTSFLFISYFVHRLS